MKRHRLCPIAAASLVAVALAGCGQRASTASEAERPRVPSAHRSDLPEVTPPAAPSCQRPAGYELPNGLRVITVSSDGAPVFSARLELPTPSDPHTRRNAWLCAADLADGPETWHEPFPEWVADRGIKWEGQSRALHATGTTREANDILAVIAATVLDPPTRTTAFERRRGEAIESVEETLDGNSVHPTALGAALLDWYGKPAGKHLDRKLDDLRNIRPQDCVALRRLIAQPTGAILYVISPFDEDEVHERVAQHFSCWTDRPEAPAPDVGDAGGTTLCCETAAGKTGTDCRELGKVEFAGSMKEGRAPISCAGAWSGTGGRCGCRGWPEGAGRILAVHLPGREQAYVQIGGFVDDAELADDPVISGVVEILASARESRLNRVVRRGGLGYNAEGRWRSGDGTMELQTQLELGTLEDGLLAILREIENLWEDGPSQDEVELARPLALRSLRPPDALIPMVWTLAEEDRRGMTRPICEERARNAIELDARRLHAAARRVLDPERMVVVVLADLTARLGNGESIEAVLDHVARESFLPSERALRVDPSTMK